MKPEKKNLENAIDLLSNLETDPDKFKEWLKLFLIKEKIYPLIDFSLNESPHDYLSNIYRLTNNDRFKERLRYAVRVLFIDWNIRSINGRNTEPIEYYLSLLNLIVELPVPDLYSDLIELALSGSYCGIILENENRDVHTLILQVIASLSLPIVDELEDRLIDLVKKYIQDIRYTPICFRIAQQIKYENAIEYIGQLLECSFRRKFDIYSTIERFLWDCGILKFKDLLVPMLLRLQNNNMWEYFLKIIYELGVEIRVTNNSTDPHHLLMRWDIYNQPVSQVQIFCENHDIMDQIAQLGPLGIHEQKNDIKHKIVEKYISKKAKKSYSGEGKERTGKYRRGSMTKRDEKKSISEKVQVKKKPALEELQPNSRDNSAQHMLQENPGRLKVVNVLARQIAKTHGKLFEVSSGILLLHALEDLSPFLDSFESLGLSPSEAIFYYKRYPYFNKDKTLGLLHDRGYQAEPMEKLDNTLPEFLQRIDSSRRIFVLEDGGYIGPFLHQHKDTPWNQIVGAVEQTERGVRMYESIQNLLLPVAPVARCGLKNRQEPPHIGRTIVSNIQRLLPDRNLAGMRCLVIGYGRIGEAVCSAARGHGMNVSVYDSNPGALSKATQDSFNTRDNLNMLLSDAQIVIGTTGNESLGRDHILSLQHNTVLVSGSSGQYEIGLEALDILSRDRKPIDIGTQYTLEKEDRKILLLGDGYPINFVGGDSVPNEAIDPVLGALLIATIAMVQDPPSEKGIQLKWTNQIMAHFELEKLYYDLYFSR